MVVEAISDLIRSFEKDPKPARHELAAMVNEIKKVVPFEDKAKYGYKYWLGKLKRSGIRYGALMVLLKDAEKIDPKYNKGGFITNKLKR